MEQHQSHSHTAFNTRKRKQKEAHEKRKEKAKGTVLALYHSGQHNQRAIERETGISLRLVRAILVEAGLHTVKERDW